MTSLVDELLPGTRSVLLAGAGGGYDVLGALPLWADLRAAGRDVHLASLSFSYLDGLDGARRIAAAPCLYEVGAAAAVETAYCPEAWLARFLAERAGVDRPVWCLDKVGVRPLTDAYRWLVGHLGVDAIVLVDGGVDAILRGDESSLGTPSEDLASLAAAAALGVPGLVACVGLGAELRDGICHEQVFARIAELARRDGYRGAAALVAGTPRGELYRDAVGYCFAHQATQRQSHVHRVVTAAMAGEYGEVAPHVWLSALLPMHWFFALDAVAGSHLFLDQLAGTETIWEVVARIEGLRAALPVRPRTTIPI
ncbi:MAG: DUF1152 domain-containing protein [Kofleriaceae bacterium]|nr:DUF1152 domain-containing protein [Myxococcales bacterium]MCB9572120.1 DUF1152 domain-containing protein [Kofleriaceae bacterium]